MHNHGKDEISLVAEIYGAGADEPKLLPFSPPNIEVDVEAQLTLALRLAARLPSTGANGVEVHFVQNAAPFPVNYFLQGRYHVYYPASTLLDVIALLLEPGTVFFCDPQEVANSGFERTAAGSSD